MRDLWSLAEEEARKWGLPAGLTSRVMHQESRGRTAAVSPKGARGPMQLMPGTARDMGVNIDDPEDNVRGGVRYLAQQYREFGTPELALAAYNAGPGAVKKYGGVPPYRETRNYVRAIMGTQGMRPKVKEMDGADIFADPKPPGPAGLNLRRNEGGEIEFDATLAGGAGGGTLADGSDIFADQAKSVETPQTNTAAALKPKAPATSASLLQKGLQGDVTGFFANLNRGLLVADEAQGAMNATRDVLAGRSKINPRAAVKALLYATPPVAAALGRTPGDAYAAFKETGIPAAFDKGMEKQRSLEDEFTAKRPYVAATARGLGNAATVAVPAGAAGNLVSGASPLMTAARGASAAALPGYAAGFADRGTLKERKDAGVIGAALAAPIGAGAALLASRGSRAPAPSREARLEHARQALDDMGLEMDRLPQEARDEIAQLVDSGRSGRDAAVVAASRALPEPVPMTRGQVTLDPVQQLDENVLLRGGEGARAAEVMRGHQARQQAALRGNTNLIAEDLGGGVAADRGDAGAAVSGRLNEMRDAANQRVQEAYRAARAGGEGVILPREQVPVVASRLREAVKDYTPIKTPGVQEVLGRLDDVGGATQVRDLFEVRQQLSTLRRGNDQIEASAARAASNELDSYLSEALDADLFSGDGNAVRVWRDAINQRREFGNLFESRDLISTLTERAYRGGEPTLAVDPRDASNYIFGRSEMGVAGRKDLTRDLERLRDVLGSDSPQWNAIRSESFQRIARSGEGATEGGVRQFSGVNFSKAWSKFNQADPDLAAALYSADERAQIDQLASVAARATSPVRGGDNSSNTAVTAKRLFERFSRSLPFARDILEALERQAATNRAVGATSGAVPPAAAARTPGRISPRTYRLIGVAAGSKKESR